MAESEIVKVELELPRDQVHIEPMTSPAEPEESSADARITELSEKLSEYKNKNEDESKKESPVDQIKALTKRDPLKKLPALQDKTPPNHAQKIVIGVGLTIALAGLILWPATNFVLALSVALIGAILVSLGTFIKV